MKTEIYSTEKIDLSNGVKNINAYATYTNGIVELIPGNGLKYLPKEGVKEILGDITINGGSKLILSRSRCKMVFRKINEKTELHIHEYKGDLYFLVVDHELVFNEFDLYSRIHHDIHDLIDFSPIIDMLLDIESFVNEYDGKLKIDTSLLAKGQDIKDIREFFNILTETIKQQL